MQTRTTIRVAMGCILTLCVAAVVLAARPHKDKLPSPFVADAEREAMREVSERNVSESERKASEDAQGVDQERHDVIHPGDIVVTPHGHAIADKNYAIADIDFDAQIGESSMSDDPLITSAPYDNGAMTDDGRVPADGGIRLPPGGIYVVGPRRASAIREPVGDEAQDDNAQPASVQDYIPQDDYDPYLFPYLFGWGGAAVTDGASQPQPAGVAQGGNAAQSVAPPQQRATPAGGAANSAPAPGVTTNRAPAATPVPQHPSGPRY